ncbi:SRPBCC family protein [Haladaptatus sp. DJG-WS-42]|uniref:SRPBCC family protein n=1 Tax=Haladaptatus sp. DJG-WS-42 TaxID=3120516 RepID=UPI0030D35509
MARVESATTIRAPQEYVWELVCDVNRYPEISSAFTERVTYVSDGPVGKGTVYREYGGVGPMKDESEWMITEFAEPTRQIHEGDLGVMQPVLTIELESIGEDTRLFQALDFEMLPQVRPVGRLLEAVFVKRTMQRGLDDTVANVKRIAEREYETESKQPMA